MLQQWSWTFQGRCVCDSAEREMTVERNWYIRQNMYTSNENEGPYREQEEYCNFNCRAHSFLLSFWSLQNPRWEEKTNSLYNLQCLLSLLWYARQESMREGKWVFFREMSLLFNHISSSFDDDFVSWSLVDEDFARQPFYSWKRRNITSFPLLLSHWSWFKYFSSSFLCNEKRFPRLKSFTP